jgi:streptogramin lyase
LRPVVLRLAVPFALIAAALCASIGIFQPAKAQDRPVKIADGAIISHTSTAAKTAAPLVIASGTRFANVRGLASDASGGLYISLSTTPAPQDCVSSAISVPRSVGNETGEAGTGLSNAAKIPLTIFSDCTVARAEDPSGIAVVPGGSVYLANRAQNSIRLLDMITGKVSALPLAAKGKFAAQSASSNLDPHEPAGLASDREGNLYIADRGNGRVLELHTASDHFGYIAHVFDAAAVAVNPAGTQLFVASPLSNRIFIIDLRSNALDVFAGSGAPMEAGVMSDTNPAKAALGAPEGVAVDGAGNVFIADTGANALLRVDAATGELSRVETSVNLNSPGALAIDRRGDVFLADRGNARVLEFSQLASPQSAGAITISPTTFDFGSEPTGGSAPLQQFTMTNGSGTALTLSNQNFAFTGANGVDFSQSNNCVPSLPAGGSCLINVKFTPSATGVRSATLQVTDADPSSPQTATISGTGDDFQLTAASQVATIQNVAPGQTATYTLSVTPDTTFGGTVTLACPAILSGNTQTIKCNINPASVAITPGQAQNFTVTLATGGPNATRVAPFGRRDDPGGRLRLLLLCVCTLAMLVCCLYARRAWEFRYAAGPAKRVRFAAFSLALLALAAAAGCKYHAPPVNPNETPAGIYTFDITGTAQSASRSITLTLNVD